MAVSHKLKAERYYRLVGQKNIEEIKKHLDAEVEFLGPIAKLQGKEAVVAATHHFMEMFKSLRIRMVFSEVDHAIVVYNVDISAVTQEFRAVSLLTFRDNLRNFNILRHMKRDKDIEWLCGFPTE